MLTFWPEVRTTKLDQLPSQWVISRDQEFLTARLVVTHTIEDASNLVFVGMANQAI